MDENRNEVSLSIDMKKSRLRIHKTTLNLLGEVGYIQLLMNPKSKVLAVRGSETRYKDSHSLSRVRLNPDNCFELYSKSLIETIMSLLPELDRDCTYRIPGEAHPGENTAFFPLRMMQKVEGSE